MQHMYRCNSKPDSTSNSGRVCQRKERYQSRGIGTRLLRISSSLKALCNRLSFLVHIKRCVESLTLAAVITVSGCQQPAKSLSEESGKTATEKTSSSQQGKHDKKGEQGKNRYEGLEIPRNLSRSPQLLREMILQEHQIGETKAQFNAQGRIVKYVEKEVEYDMSAAFDDNLLLDPAQNSIYPGAILNGKSIEEESYREITGGYKRKAVISFDLQGVRDIKGKNGKAGITSGEIVPNLASYRELHSKILSQNITYNASAHSSYEEMEIQNKRDLEAKLKIGAGFGIGGIKSKIEAGFTFKEGEQKERRLIKFIETFYTADVNQEDEPLAINIPREQTGGKMPVYVSSVSYGRIAYLTIESDQTKSELKANLDMLFKASTTNKAESEIDAAIRKLEAGTTTTVNIIGGAGAAVTNLKEFHKYIVKGGFSEKNPGRIIKYQLRFLDDNAPAYTKYAEKYSVFERTEVPAKGYRVSAKVERLEYGNHDPIDVSGTIDMQTPTHKGTAPKRIFNAPSGSPIKGVGRGGLPLSLPYATIIVPDTSSAIQFSCDIKGKPTNPSSPEQSFTLCDVQASRGHAIVSDLQKQPTMHIPLRSKCTVDSDPALTISIRFTVEEEN